MNDLFSKLNNSKEFVVLDDERQLEKSEKQAQNFELCVRYIISHGSDTTKLISDKRALNAFKFIRFNSHVNNQFIDVFIKFEKIFENLLRIFQYYSNVLKENSNATCSKLDLTIFCHTVSITLNSSNESNKFRNKFHEYGGTKVLLSFINDNDLLEKCQILKRKEVNINGKEPTILRAISSILFNISFLADTFKSDFDNMNATAIILNFLNNRSIDDDFRMCTYLTLANMLNNNEIETLPHSKIALKGIIQLLHSAANSIGTRILKRIQIETEVNGEDLKNADLCVIESAWCNWHIGEVLYGLYLMSVNDKIKNEIFDAVKEDVKVILEKGTDFERVFTLKLLCQLCFDEKVCKKVKEDKQTYDLIQHFAELRDFKIKNLKYIAKYIIWSIDKLKIQVNLSRDSKKKLEDEKKKHIMISYNRDSREICLKIKEKLVEFGFSVWIDVEQIQGSSLDSMARAIENSFCVLICMTEKYKQSTYCRAEAEYTFTKSIPFIPLLLQNGFSADGWLGIMVGSKIYVSFPKMGFNESISKTIFEINSLKEKPVGNTKLLDSKINTNKQISDGKSFKNWTQSEVQDWLAKTDVSQEICKILKLFDGEMLVQLGRVKKTAPDYYFSSISRNNSIDLYYVLKFTTEFEKLID